MSKALVKRESDGVHAVPALASALLPGLGQLVKGAGGFGHALELMGNLAKAVWDGIKTVASSRDSSVPSMVFDEIDTGIGGRTAQMVAERIALVICIPCAWNFSTKFVGNRR